MVLHALLHLVFSTALCDKFIIILILQMRNLKFCMVKQMPSYWVAAYFKLKLSDSKAVALAFLK